MDVGHLRLERRAQVAGEREVHVLDVRQERGRLLDARAYERVGELRPGDRRAHVAGCRPVHAEAERAHQLRAAGHRAGHRSRRVEAGREREDALRPAAGPSVGLKPTTPQQAAGKAHRAGAVGAEREVAEPGRQRGAVPAARAARDPRRVERVHDGAEVRVVRRDPVGELVQVRLAHDRVAGLLEPGDAGRRALGNVVAEDRRAVGRRQPGRVDQVLDGERDPGRNLVGNRQEGAVRVSQASRR